jgi:hypothetical protein
MEEGETVGVIAGSPGDGLGDAAGDAGDLLGAVPEFFQSPSLPSYRLSEYQTGNDLGGGAHAQNGYRLGSGTGPLGESEEGRVDGFQNGCGEPDIGLDQAGDNPRVGVVLPEFALDLHQHLRPGGYRDPLQRLFDHIRGYRLAHLFFSIATGP